LLIRIDSGIAWFVNANMKSIGVEELALVLSRISVISSNIDGRCSG